MKRQRGYSWRVSTAISGGLVRDARRNEVLGELLQIGPPAVYAGLLHYAQTRNYKPGWAAHSFREIFGTWPRPQDRKVEPKELPDFLIEEWAATRQRKAPRRPLPLFETEKQDDEGWRP
jgi:hypothetical protein